jgi:hypothetical protein
VILRLQLNDRDKDASGVTAPQPVSLSLPVEFPGFERYLLSNVRPWRGLTGSVFAHCAFGCIGWVAGSYLDFHEPKPNFDARVREAASVYMQLRDLPVTFHRKSPAPERETPAPKPRLIEAPRLQELAKQTGGIAVRRFELPPMVKRAEAEQTLLQPDVAPEVKLPENLRLPEFLFWADAPKPPRARRQMVMPGRKAPLVQEPSLSAAPTIALPAETAPAALSTAAPALSANPALTLPARPTAPLRTFQPPSRQTALPTVNLDAPPGEPSAVLALHPNPAPLGSVVVVPGGNQIGKLPPELSLDAGQVSARPAGSGQAGPACCGGDGTGGANSRAGDAGGGGTTAGQATGSGAGGVAVAGLGPVGSATLVGSPPLAIANPLRQTYPKAGAFDVVVAHPSAPPDVTTGRFRLRGTPVYTVYLNVGTKPEWILRYCATNATEQPSQGNGNVVHLGNPAPIAPPYPQVTVVPPRDGNRNKIAVLHGFVTNKGQFRALEAARAEDEALLRTLEPLLGQWLFRPATRDGVPIEVEILLLLPHLL